MSSYWKGIVERRKDVLNDRTRRSQRDFVSPGNGLIRRGLVNHVNNVKASRLKQVPAGRPLETRPVFRGSHNAELNCYWRLTRAGWLVYDLLVEAGMAPAITRSLRKVA